jgi:hypothetical protein
VSANCCSPLHKSGGSVAAKLALKFFGMPSRIELGSGFPR